MRTGNRPSSRHSAGDELRRIAVRVPVRGLRQHCGRHPRTDHRRRMGTLRRPPDRYPKSLRIPRRPRTPPSRDLAGGAAVTRGKGHDGGSGDGGDAAPDSPAICRAYPPPLLFAASGSRGVEVRESSARPQPKHPQGVREQAGYQGFHFGDSGFQHLPSGGAYAYVA